MVEDGKDHFMILEEKTFATNREVVRSFRNPDESIALIISGVKFVISFISICSCGIGDSTIISMV